MVQELCYRLKDKTEKPTDVLDLNLTKNYHHHIAEKALGIVMINKLIITYHSQKCDASDCC